MTPQNLRFPLFQAERGCSICRLSLPNHAGLSTQHPARVSPSRKKQNKQRHTQQGHLSARWRLHNNRHRGNRKHPSANRAHKRNTGEECRATVRITPIRGRNGFSPARTLACSLVLCRLRRSKLLAAAAPFPRLDALPDPNEL